jgi:hypothetical protein
LSTGATCDLEPLRQSILQHIRYALARPSNGLVPRELLKPVSLAIRDWMIDRLLKTEQPIEMQFSLPDRWQRRLFSALCRRYGLEPFRYKRQRYTTVMIRVPRSFVDKTLWPEYLQIKDALDEYLSEATERIIREEVFRDAGEAPERGA